MPTLHKFQPCTVLGRDGAGVESMGMVMIRCPSSGRTVSTGIELEKQTFIQLPDVSSGMSCSACGGHHIWRKAEAWLNDGSAGSPPDATD
jgi:hypothetical protein